MTKISTEELWTHYQTTKSVHRTGEYFGLHGASIHERLQKAGHEMDGSGKKFTEAENDMIRQVYALSPRMTALNLPKLAVALGRDHHNVCRQARKLGLTDDSRKSTIAQRDAMTVRALADMKQGIVPKSFYPNIKKGWAKFSGGRRYFLKSGWEFKYADYLEMLFRCGVIKGWEYEPDTFWFLKIMRGVRSYTPDFKIYLTDGTIEYHEVKGWMDGKSKTKINRMRIYHRTVKLLVIGRNELRALGLI